MKKCPNCGKITDRKFCSDCGTSLIDVPEIEELSNEAITDDNHVEEIAESKIRENKDLNKEVAQNSSEDIIVDDSTGEAGGDTIIQPSIAAVDSSGKAEIAANPGKKKIIIAVAAIFAIIVIAIAGVSISNASKAKAAKEEYDFAVSMMRAKAVMMSMKVNNIASWDESIDTCEELINLTNSVWHDAIYDDYNTNTSKYVSGASDFQEALENLYADSDIVAFTSTLDDPVENLFMDQIPENLADVKSSFVKLVTAYKDIASWCKWPNGSYNTYMTQSQEKYDAFNNAYNEFDIICPKSTSDGEDDD